MIGKTISHYKISEKLGGGGMGVVYKAEDTKLKRKVAIKFLPRHISANKEDRQRFEIEAQAAAALNHPNIATIHAIEEYDDEMFIVMEYIDGKELKDKIKSGPISTDEVINIANQIAEGLDVAHKKGIIHRDIKSSNIMITKDGKVKIMDFGLAKIKGETELTKIGSTVGTVAYMSPEQTKGEEVDRRTDIWSFGVVLYEMLTGELPFKGDYEQAVIYSILNEDPDLITGVKNNVLAGLEQMVLKMLSKNRKLRHQSIENLLKILSTVRAETESEDLEEKAIAILPFENISADKETDYFADGLTEELIVSLSKLKIVSIVARTTSMLYKDSKKNIKTIGEELSAHFVMEGSVRKYKDNLRISVRLIDVSKGTQLWGETYKGRLADVFDIQELVSEQIVDALRVKLTPTEKLTLEKRATLNFEAFDLNLRARDFMYRLTKSDVQNAIQLFQKALELDPHYAAAYAGLSEAYGNLYQEFERKEMWLDKAIEASLKALTFDSTLAEAYASLGLAHFNKGLLDEALTAGKKAIELDTNNFIGYWILGRIYHSTDQDREALKMFQKIVELNPDFYSTYGYMRMVYERLGEKEKYDETLQIALQDTFPRYLSQHPDDARGHMFFGIELTQAGRIEEGKSEITKALELRPNDPLLMYSGACAYARLGDKDIAIDFLKKSIAGGFENYAWMKRDPDLESIRKEQEYKTLLKGSK